MKHLLRLSDLNKNNLNTLFDITDNIINQTLKYTLDQKTCILFFPTTSIRTRVTFEKGIHMMGGQSILFPSNSLEGREALQDKIGYLNNWADCIIIRHEDFTLVEKCTAYSKVPVINAMTKQNHPCEILGDLFALSKINPDFLKSNYLYIGPNSNIGYAWKEAAVAFGLSFMQCCPLEFAMEGIYSETNIHKALVGKDVVITDSLPASILPAFSNYQLNIDLLKYCNKNVRVNPCPPFYRGEEISKEIIDSPYFVGYEFKKYLLEVQQAIIYYCICL